LECLYDEAVFLSSRWNLFDPSNGKAGTDNFGVSFVEIRLGIGMGLDS
jgi:hypothetical protein